MSLAREHCQVCRPGTTPLDDHDAAALLPEIDEAWTIDAARLRRDIKLKDFASALSLAVRLGMIAEAEGHHPDLTVSWGRLTIELTTHAADGLTRNDFIVAAKFDAALA